MSDDRVTSPAVARRRGRPPKRLETTVEIRDALVAAACAAFCENGFHGTNTNEIAHRAGLAAGTLYNYFTDKIDIFLAVYDRWLLDEWRSIDDERQLWGAPRLAPTACSLCRPRR